MKFVLKMFKYCSVSLIIMGFFSLLTPEIQAFQSGSKVTPVDVYYLAKSIDDSLAAMYNLKYQFNKKAISNNIRPRNSYQKLLNVADEFNLLHPGSIDQTKMDQARRVDPLNTKPADLYAVLSMMRDYLVSQYAYKEFEGLKTPKTPSDVTQMLRQISYHHIEIAKQKNISTDWSTPAQVYDAIMHDIYPVVHTMAAEVNFQHEEYDFPLQPVEAIVPRNITKVLQHIYQNISDYYTAKGQYNPLVLIEVNKCDDISPGDSFDLIKAISAELRAMSGKNNLDTETAGHYAEWKNAKTKIAPGDVFRLLQYNYIVSKRIREIQLK